MYSGVWTLEGDRFGVTVEPGIGVQLEVGV